MSTPVSIVIPVHNRAELTRRCLDAVRTTVPAECETIVVDDASSDGTAGILTERGDEIRVLTLSENAGFATACNRGAQGARHDLLVFLNNDTEPQPGWLEALLAEAEAHPEADVVGAKLVYPGGTVQHAGVVFGQDGYPHHLYAGLPAGHPAVNRSRPLRAVTAACMLVRRAAFEAAGGFDAGYRNSLEDVDLCLRIGERGGGVRYCAGAVVQHLESASRGRDDRFETSVALYRERWRDRVRRDDLEIYAADALLEVEYADSYPVRMAVSPRLAILDAGREEEIERLLEAYARQVSDLMQEVVRLTASVPGDRADAGSSTDSAGERSRTADHAAFLARARRLESEIRELQLEAEGIDGGFTASSRLGYRQLVEAVRAAVAEHVPPGATVLVISRGDRELVRLDGRIGEHFPQGDDGRYLGHHPADSAAAIEQLETLRARGADYLVVPPTAAWWLDHYEELAAHLKRYPRVESDGAAAIYRLEPQDSTPKMPTDDPTIRR
jgi:GT2 family glycosyltransferase